MSSRGLLGPGMCYFPLVHSISHSLIWFYMFSCLFKPPTPLSMSSLSAPALLAVLWREQTLSEEDIWEFPHLAGPIPSTIHPLCTEVQPVHLCLIPAVLLQSQGHYCTFGEAATVQVISSRCGFQSAPMHFFNPSHIYHLWDVLDKTVETESN